MSKIPPQLRQIDMDKSGAQVLRQEINAIRADAIAGRSGLLGSPALAIGSTKPRIATGAFYFTIAGVLELKAAVAAGTAFTDTTHDIADPDALGREAIYVVSIAAGGTITITMGSVAALTEAVAPSVPASGLYLGQVLVAHNGSAVFNANTDDLDAAHLTVTYTSQDPTAQPSLSDVTGVTSQDLTS